MNDNNHSSSEEQLNNFKADQMVEKLKSLGLSYEERMAVYKEGSKSGEDEEQIARRLGYGNFAPQVQGKAWQTDEDVKLTQDLQKFASNLSDGSGVLPPSSHVPAIENPEWLAEFEKRKTSPNKIEKEDLYEKPVITALHKGLETTMENIRSTEAKGEKYTSPDKGVEYVSGSLVSEYMDSRPEEPKVYGGNN